MALIMYCAKAPVGESRQTGRRRKRIMCLFFLGLMLGCAPMIKQPPPSLTGTFTGNTPAGDPLTITFHQRDNTVIGYGELGARSFGLSALASWHAPMVLAFHNGSIIKSRVTLSPDGNTVTVHLPGEKVVMNRGGTPVGAPSGPFAGRYCSKRPIPVWTKIAQSGDLIAGIGFFRGKPVAVVGKVTGPRQARGTVLFADESRNAVKVTLSDDSQTLTVLGLGGPIEMRRQ